MANHPGSASARRPRLGGGRRPSGVAPAAAAAAAVTWLALGMAGCRGADPAAVPGPGGPNVLLITVDTLRADRLGCHGHTRPTSPAIDGLAADGFLFERAYAQQGTTWPSLASFMTSLYPVTHGVRENGQPISDEPLTLAEILAGHGYRCGAVLTNAYDQNWEGFHDVLEPDVPGTDGEMTDEDAEAERQIVGDQQATELALRWLKRRGREPFFLWVHYLSPHDPYTPPAEHDRFTDPAYDGPLDGSRVASARVMLQLMQPDAADRDHLMGLYDGEVAFTDGTLAALIDWVRERGLLDRTLVVFSADHGEELLDHHDYMFHSASPYEGVMHIPLVFRQPGVVPAGGREGAVVESVDVAPTVLALLGLEPPAAFAGRSLAAAFAGDTVPPRPSVAEVNSQILSVRSGRFHYVANPNHIQPGTVPENLVARVGGTLAEGVNRFPLGREELYDLVADPGERRDLAPTATEDLRAMRRLTEDLQRQLGWTPADEEAREPGDLRSSDTERRLRELGYLER